MREERARAGPGRSCGARTARARPRESGARHARAMVFVARAPEARLAPFVESLWIQEEPRAEPGLEPTVLLPVGRATLVIEYGDPFEELDARGAPSRLSPVLLAGQRSAPARVRSSGRTGLVLVNFRPCGAAAFFGPQEECAERFADVAALSGERAVRRVAEEVRSAPDPLARLAATQRFLLALRSTDAPDARVVAASELILRSRGSAPIEKVSAELGLGRRHLARLFAREVGLAPKVFARIVRFQHALRRARGGEGWARVAPAAGYHDQAHLSKECVALSGCTPGELVAGIEERAVGRFFNDGDPELARFATYL